MINIDKSCEVTIAKMPSNKYQIKIADSSIRTASGLLIGMVILRHANLMHKVFPTCIEYPYSIEYTDNGPKITFLYEVNSLHNLGELAKLCSEDVPEERYYLLCNDDEDDEEVMVLVKDIEAKKNDILTVILDFKHLVNVQYNLITKYQLNPNTMHINGSLHFNVLKDHLNLANKHLLVSDNCIRAVELIRDALFSTPLEA